MTQKSVTHIKSILVITSEYYGSANKIGSHSLAEEFSNIGIETYVISFPITPLYAFAAKKTDYKTRKALSNGWNEVNSKLFIWVPETLIPPIPAIVKLVPSVLSNWLNFVPARNRQFAKKSFDLVLTDSIFYNSLIDQIAYKSLVLRIPDNFSGFWPNNTTLYEAEQELIKKSDVIVSPSKTILNNLKNVSHKVCFLPNGVELKHYAKKLNRPEHLISTGTEFNAVYVGAIKDWFDHNLLMSVATKKQNWSFTIIGKRPDDSLLSCYPKNVFFIGEKVGNEKIALLQYANAGLIPFETEKSRTLIETVNPIKLYEYLAAGLPVVSTSWQELERLEPPIQLCKDAQSFSEALTRLETEQHNGREGIDFVAKYTWPEITKTLLNRVTGT